MFDCIVIGGGVVGAAILDSLCQRGYEVALLEREDDVATGASRANSGIVHAGYDCVPNTLKAKFNVLGNAMYPRLTAELDVPFKKTGSLVVSGDGGRDALAELLSRAEKNGVSAELIERDKILELEPNVSDEVTLALYAKDAGVVSPYKLTIALCDRAVMNGATVVLECEVTKIRFENGIFIVETPKGDFQSYYLINSAGANANEINAMLQEIEYPMDFKKGEYFVLDSTEGANVSRVIFPLPDERGKGILVAPTADGNVIYGPTSVWTKRDDTSVSAEGLNQIKESVARVYKCPNYKKVIRLYAGLRTASGDDFIIRRSVKNKNYFMLIGICSPGLTAAPAIGEYIADEISNEYAVKKKMNVVTELKHVKFKNLTPEEHAALLAEDSRWGRIICRCEKVTEAEIVAAIHSPVPATTVDAVKRRVRAGMGRCQGGFCAPRVMEILSRELNIPMTSVKKGGKGSEIAVAKVKEVSYENL
jgi:Predicted dehydrogenase